MIQIIILWLPKVKGVQGRDNLGLKQIQFAIYKIDKTTCTYYIPQRTVVNIL